MERERGQGGGVAQAAIAGDPAALREVWRTHRRWVAAIVLSHMPSEMELEDLLQDVATVVVERIGEVRDPGSLRSWLRTVAINTARSAGRKQRVRRRAMRELAPTATETDGHAIRDGIRDEARRQARRVLELAMRLPPDYREPLLLRSLHGMSQKRIAAELGVPETTVETRLARARKMLREEMAFDAELDELPVARARSRS
jgi:RNA polymerase sigma-70 factor (ECF subfamily)